MPGIEPGAAGYEARMLSIVLASPLPSGKIFCPNKFYGQLFFPSNCSCRKTNLSYWIGFPCHLELLDLAW